MKINRNGLIYRFIMYYAEYKREPRDLCEWMKGLVKAVMVTLFVGIVICLSIFGFFIVSLEFLVTWVNFFLIGEFIPYMTETLGLFYIINIVLLSYGLVYAIEKRKKGVYKKPGIIRQYLKAKKEKICPLIEYEER